MGKTEERIIPEFLKHSGNDYANFLFNFSCTDGYDSSRWRLDLAY